MDIVTAQEMYEWDRVAIEEAGISGPMLMESAGRAVADDLARFFGKEERVVVLIGSGHNGGDGFVLAKTLLNRGYLVDAWQVVPDRKITGDAAVHKQIMLASGHSLVTFSKMDELEATLEKADVIIDTMLGIGVKGQLRTPFAEIVKAVNRSSAICLAVDLPTGVPADESEEEIQAFRADYTSIVAAPKMSAFLNSARPFYGEWGVVEIGLPSTILPSSGRSVWRKEDVKRTLPKRAADGHKGTFGKGLMIGGSAVMPGSVSMAARAALRSCAGLLTLATAEEAIPSIAPFLQEATFSRLSSKNGFICGQAPSSLSDYDGIAAGMGMGREESSRPLLDELLANRDTPLLIDADGLYLLKESLNTLKVREAVTVLTPHPGEMAHLSGESIADVIQHPFSLSREFASEYGVYLVLKGPSTIITAPDGRQRVDDSGNAGLAKGGSGDVLSGILLAMLMQSDSVLDALSNGCVIHGTTAELLTEDRHSMNDLLATDVIEGLSRTFRTFSSQSI